MIIDKLSNIGIYSAILPGVDNGLKALESLGEKPPVGRYEFEGGYFMIQEGGTKEIDAGDFEAHRKYIDVQIVLEGEETVAWSHIRSLTETEAYSEERDRQMLSGAAEQCNRITAGMVWAAFPEDAHKACRHTGEKTTYRKAVMKLPL